MKIVAEHLWNQAEQASLCWPSDHSSAQAFLENATEFSMNVRNQKVEGKAVGFPGGITPKHSYCAKSLTRGLALVVEEYDPHAFVGKLS